MTKYTVQLYDSKGDNLLSSDDIVQLDIGDRWVTLQELDDEGYYNYAFRSNTIGEIRWWESIRD